MIRKATREAVHEMAQLLAEAALHVLHTESVGFVSSVGGKQAQG